MESGESSAKKSRKEQQRTYNQKRNEKPRKPQFSLNFQFCFGEEEEMKWTQKRFVRLRRKANVRSRRANTDFLQALLNKKKAMESHEVPENRAMHSVSVQTNATETFIKLYAHRDDHVDFQCQWPDREAAQSTAVVTDPGRREIFHDQLQFQKVQSWWSIYNQRLQWANSWIKWHEISV